MYNINSNDVRVFPAAGRSGQTLTEDNVTFLVRPFFGNREGFVYSIENVGAEKNRILFSLYGYSFDITVPAPTNNSGNSLYAKVPVDNGQIVGIDDIVTGEYSGLYLSNDGNVPSIGYLKNHPDTDWKILKIATKNSSGNSWEIPTESSFIGSLISGIDGKR